MTGATDVAAVISYSTGVRMPSAECRRWRLRKISRYSKIALPSSGRVRQRWGRVARDADGAPVGSGDLTAQAEQAYANVHAAATVAGGSPGWTGRTAPA